MIKRSKMILKNIVKIYLCMLFINISYCYRHSYITDEYAQEQEEFINNTTSFFRNYTTKISDYLDKYYKQYLISYENMIDFKENVLKQFNIVAVPHHCVKKKQFFNQDKNDIVYVQTRVSVYYQFIKISFQKISIYFTERIKKNIISNIETVTSAFKNNIDKVSTYNYIKMPQQILFNTTIDYKEIFKNNTYDEQYKNLFTNQFTNSFNFTVNCTFEHSKINQFIDLSAYKYFFAFIEKNNSQQVIFGKLKN